jgi:hypothetical protein
MHGLSQGVRVAKKDIGGHGQGPDDALVRREYDVTMPDGQKAALAFTLGDPSANSNSAGLARLAGASVYGLVSLIDVPAPPKHPVLWMQRDFDLFLAVADDDEIGEELQAVISRHLGIFFAEIVPIIAAVAQPERITPALSRERIAH